MVVASCVRMCITTILNGAEKADLVGLESVSSETDRLA